MARGYPCNRKYKSIVPNGLKIILGLQIKRLVGPSLVHNSYCKLEGTARYAMRAYYAVMAHLGLFWCSVVTLVIFSSNLNILNEKSCLLQFILIRFYLTVTYNSHPSNEIYS